MKKLILSAALALAPLSAMAAGETHHLAIHVNQNDPAVMNMALNNAQNVYQHYKDQGDDVVIELVAYGPGLNMLIDGKSPVADRISAMSLEMDHLQLSACGNTMAKMQRASGKEVPLLSEAVVVSSGVVRLMELQGDGYAYVRP